MIFFAATVGLSSSRHGLILSIYERNHRLMRWQIQQVLGKENHSVSIEDLLQDALERLMKNAATLERLLPEQQRAYAILTAKRVAITELTRRRQRERWCYYPSEETACEDEYSHLESSLDLGYGMERLSERDRDLVYYYYFLGLKRKEICKLIGISASDFYPHLCRVRHRLYEILTEKGDGENE